MVKLVTEAEALPIIEAAIAQLKGEKPDAKSLFKRETFDAFAALTEERRDELILEIRELRGSSRKLRDVIPLSCFNERVQKAVRTRYRAQAEKRRAAAITSARPTIVVGGQLRDISDAAFKAIIGANNPPVLMAHGGSIVRVIIDEKGRPKIERLTHAQLKRQLSRVADFVEVDDNPAWPPSTVVQDILESGEWPGLPALAGVTTVPLLRPDGTFHVDLGYDTVTGWYYSPPEGFELPEIPDNPTDDELKKAVLVLWEPFKEFPFVDKASWANLIAFILTLFLRAAIDGNVVLFIFTANMQGTGKSLLHQLAAMVALGIEEGEVFAPTDNEEEMRKRITTALKSGLPIITIDNQEKRLNSQALSTLLTTRNWRDRFLGTNESASLPNNAVVTVTGNNIRVGDDQVRRSALIELRADSETPWRGRQFIHKKIVQWVREHRADLLGAVMLMVRGWYARGCPEDPCVKPLGHFERWSEMVGGILHTAGISGFLENADKLREMNDGDSVKWKGFFAEWFNQFLDTPRTVSEVCKLAADPARHEEDDDLRIALREALPQYLAPSTKHAGDLRHRLGNAFKCIAGAPYGNYMLEKVGISSASNTMQWRVIARNIEKLPGRTRNAYRVVQWLRDSGWFDATGHAPEALVSEKIAGSRHKDIAVVEFPAELTPDMLIKLRCYLKYCAFDDGQIASMCSEVCTHFRIQPPVIAGTAPCPGAVPASVPEITTPLGGKS